MKMKHGYIICQRGHPLTDDMVRSRIVVRKNKAGKLCEYKQVSCLICEEIYYWQSKGRKDAPKKGKE